jgi:hypothetical protein
MSYSRSAAASTFIHSNTGKPHFTWCDLDDQRRDR